MTTKEALHQLVDELPEDWTELARILLEDLRDAADTDGPALDPETIASLDHGLAGIAAGRVKPLDSSGHGSFSSPKILSTRVFPLQSEPPWCTQRTLEL